MSFTSLKFLAFIAACLVIYYVMPRKYRWTVLLAVSYGFYASGGVKMLVYLGVTTVTTWVAGLILQKINDRRKGAMSDEKAFRRRQKRKKHLVTALVCLVNFTMLFVLKYWDFTAETVNAHMGSDKLPVLGLLMPLGVSFYIFQSVGYVVDVSRGKVKACLNPAKYALFVSFFPQIIQGPIGRYGDLAPQLMAGNSLNPDNIKDGIQLAMWGYLKKLVIAERAGIIVNAVYTDGGAYDGAVIAFAVLMYCIQLYCDFSGGIDISRGVAKLFGIDMAENFERPIFARSLADYWRRWHMTLGTWMKDYVFYPISLSKPFNKLGRISRKYIHGMVGKIIPTSLATFIVYLLIGIWHGANYTYIAFGLYNGAIMTSSLLLAGAFKNAKDKLGINDASVSWKVFSTVRTALLVFAGRYLTRAPYLKMSLIMMKRTVFDFHVSSLFSGVISSLGMSGYDLAVVAGGCAAVLILEYIAERGTDVRAALSRRSFFIQWLAIFLPLAAIIVFGVIGRSYVASSFIYAQF